LLSRYVDKVFLMDTMDLLRQLPDNSVDMVFGDPDYNVGVKYRGKSYKRSFDEYIEWYVGACQRIAEGLEGNGKSLFHKLPETKRVPEGEVPG